MSRKSCLAWGLVGIMCLGGAPAFAQLTEVINEDFEDVAVGALPGNATGVLAGAGNPQVIDDGCGNLVLSLTQGVNNQGAWVWFDETFDLTEKRVEVEFDLFIGRGTTTPPADGVSVIFQFDEDLTAIGDAGGGLGVGNLRGQDGTPHEYIAASFDIWWNGDAVDPTDPVHAEQRYGAQSSAHTEVNQNIDPENVRSQAIGPAPDYIASGDIYGTPATPAAGTCDEGDLIHVKLIFDNRLLIVTMSGPASDVDPLQPFEEQEVINYATQPFPEGSLSNIGFTASTGGANAHQWIDNLVVREGDSLVSFDTEPPLTEGAMTCGGPEDVDAAAEIGTLFLADADFGEEKSRTGDLQTGLTIISNRFGRIQGPNITNNTRPIDVSQIPGAGAETAKVFAYNRWADGPIEYLAEVVPGKYEVSLYFAEDFTGAVNGLGQGTKIINALVAGEQALCGWSAAAAAGSPTGSGDPKATCVAVLDTAIVRTFTVNVPDGGDGYGSLPIVIEDLGGGNPPENATLNGLAFKRVGDADGSSISGDVECFETPAAPDPDGVLISTDFEDDIEATCPEGMTCNDSSGAYSPQVALDAATSEFRLRVAEDLVGNIGSSAIFNQTVNVVDAALIAEFDIYMAWGDDQAPADGGSFFVLEGTNTSAVGAAGGALGIPGGTGFTVEFDTWQGGGNNEPSGYNVAEAWTHLGINNMSTNSIITNVQFDPNLKPVAFGGTGWPDFRNPEGVHCKVTYNAGTVEVELEGITEDGATVFGPEVVARADVWPLSSTEAVVGFTGGTGGANQTIEFDNIEISANEGEPDTSDPTAAAIAQARERWETQGELYINCGGPTLMCSANQFPAPEASGDASTGDSVVWIGDQAAGASFDGEFFSVTPLDNPNGTQNTLAVAGTNMGYWDARGTEAGVDDNDLVFHYERYNDLEYDIPVANGTYTVTLYFANSYSGTAGTARRFFHVDVEGERKDGFEHCEFSGKPSPLAPAIDNPVFGFDDIFDPVDAADQMYSPDPCNFAACEANGVTVLDDPDQDQVTADLECGNAAAVALRYDVTVSDGSLTIAITDPDTALGEPVSPDGNPKISGISVKSSGIAQPVFHRGDSNADGDINITDGIFVLNFLFLGGETPPCMESANPNDDGDINITDGIYILNFLFLGGPAPAAPGPPSEACGPDVNAPNLGCDSYTNC